LPRVKRTAMKTGRPPIWVFFLWKAVTKDNGGGAKKQRFTEWGVNARDKRHKTGGECGAGKNTRRCFRMDNTRENTAPPSKTGKE